MRKENPKNLPDRNNERVKKTIAVTTVVGTCVAMTTALHMMMHCMDVIAVVGSLIYCVRAVRRKKGLLETPPSPTYLSLVVSSLKGYINELILGKTIE